MAVLIAGANLKKESSWPLGHVVLLPGQNASHYATLGRTLPKCSYWLTLPDPKHQRLLSQKQLLFLEPCGLANSSWRFLSLLPRCSLGSVGHSGPLSPLLPQFLFALFFSLLLHHRLDSVGHSGPLGLWQLPRSSLLPSSPFFI